MLKRRGFLHWLGLSTSAAVLPLPATRAETRQQVDLIDTSIAGLQYYAGRQLAVLQTLRVGDQLELRREPTNQHDDLAIEVFTLTGHKLGYVPRFVNEIPARLADQGIELGAEIYAIDLEADWWERIMIAVYQRIVLI